MRYIEYGTRKTPVSEVVLGTMRVWEKSPADVADLIQTALDCGINAVDTADIYGPSETLIGQAFAQTPSLRERVWLQTKVGIRRNAEHEFNYFDFSKGYIIEAVNASLTKLQTDHVDSLLLHRPDALMVPEEVAEAFEILRSEGKVLDFGVSNQNPAQVHRLQKYLPFPLAANQVQLSAAFTPALDAGLNVNMENDASVMRDGGIFEYAYEHDMAVQAWSVMQHGYFQGVFLGDASYPELNAALKQIAQKHNATPMAVALAWVLRHPCKMQAVVGTTRPERIRESASACDFELTRAEWYQIYLAGPRQLP